MGQDLRSDCEGLVALMSCFCVGLVKNVPLRVAGSQ